MTDKCPICGNPKPKHRKYCSQACAHSAASMRWQQRQLAAGRCVACGRKRKHYKRLCDVHARAHKRSTQRRINQRMPVASRKAA